MELVELARNGKTAALRQALPWTASLPEEDMATLLTELAAAQAAPESIDLLLTQWKHSADIYADPELHTALTRDLDPAD
ncbi:hypothetical protein [Kitasatospora sp. NPDC101183]|uniref:hypothetical protein n=1 Tax=Kitasatospora sp. NPDC101183 TaxID=3364100 RepID=UPI003817AB79